METLAYLHLALAEEAQDSSDCTASISSWKKPKLLTWLDRPHLSTATAIKLLSLTLAVGILGIARQASAMTQVGARGPEVTVLQERLLELGYFRGEVTGYYGTVTSEAVRQFQQSKGLTPDGVVGANTQAALDEPRVKESIQETLQLGDRGEQIRTLQQKLAAAGFAVSSQKGIFDEETEAAVRQFQQTKGLTVDGIVGKQTLGVLTASNVKENVKENIKESVKESVKEKTPAAKKSRSWYDDKSAPLQPFIERQN